MYRQPFYIETPVGNNAFSFEQRTNKKIFVPSLVKNVYDIALGDEIVFQDFDFDGNLIEAKGLQHFYQFDWNGIPLFLFDNHNHAYYFWYQARNEHSIGNQNILYHVDEHSDMREPEVFLSSEQTKDLQQVFEYTNFHLNVGNYIVPALREGIIQDIIQIRNEQNLLDYDPNQKNENIIFNLDLDFFQPGLDYIDYELKKKVVLDIARKAKLITVATSPFFIEQKRALEVFGDLFF